MRNMQPEVSNTEQNLLSRPQFRSLPNSCHDELDRQGIQAKSPSLLRTPFQEQTSNTEAQKCRAYLFAWEDQESLSGGDNIKGRSTGSQLV